MLTRLVVRNFKLFEEVDLELGRSVVFVGPNNSGKTTALQALALWELGVRQWASRRSGKADPKKRPGVTLNRKDLLSVPVPSSLLLWNGLHVREGYEELTEEGVTKRKTRNLRIEVLVEGISGASSGSSAAAEEWRFGLEFDYANPESIYCRPLPSGEEGDRMELPAPAARAQVAFLPPMSGLAAQETVLLPGAVDVRMGEGRTADVLRNLCLRIRQGEDGQVRWTGLVDEIRRIFGVELQAPVLIQERGEVTMTYREPSGVELDLSSSGRGLQQTLLLLAHLTLNPGSVLLLDEPDAHLEILRQRQTYRVLTEWAERHQSQVLIASHSEVVLNEAAGRDVVVAFLGRPHRIDARSKSQLLKALAEIPFDHYYQAEQKGWILYLEGSTDLATLQAFAEHLDHPSRADLEQVFVHYVGNQPGRVASHFHGLREACDRIQGFALFDRLDADPNLGGPGLSARMWSRREIECYLCLPEALIAWARTYLAGDQGLSLWGTQRGEVMERAIAEVSAAFETLGKDPWSPDERASADVLPAIMRKFYELLGLPVQTNKSDFHELAHHVPPESIDIEVREVLDAIHEVARQARPAGS